MSGELHQLSVEIGGLKEAVKNLTLAVSELRDESREEHRKVHDIIGALSGSARTLSATVTEMKPLTDDYREKRAEARGAARFLNAAYAIAGGSVAVAAGKALEYFSGRPPHP